VQRLAFHFHKLVRGRPFEARVEACAEAVEFSDRLDRTVQLIVEGFDYLFNSDLRRDLHRLLVTTEPMQGRLVVILFGRR